jgi:hypothetical protein
MFLFLVYSISSKNLIMCLCYKCKTEYFILLWKQKPSSYCMVNVTIVVSCFLKNEQKKFFVNF